MKLAAHFEKLLKMRRIFLSKKQIAAAASVVVSVGVLVSFQNCSGGGFATTFLSDSANQAASQTRLLASSIQKYQFSVSDHTRGLGAGNGLILPRIPNVDGSPAGPNGSWDGASYNYAPSVMLDNGLYKMWWCGRSDDRSSGNNGDHILYAESTSLDGSWHAHTDTSKGYEDVFRGTGSIADFDGANVCDPSVIKVNGIYYMYYSGEDINATTTMIGAAWSTDGIHWSRWSGPSASKPIIAPYRARSSVHAPLGYGAGQPSVTFIDGYFYLIYTDTTGQTSNPINGAGSYIIRSPDWLFENSNLNLPVDVLVGPGTFAPQTSGNKTSYNLKYIPVSGGTPNDMVNVDWAYVPGLDGFAIAHSNSNGRISVNIYKKDFSGELYQGEIPGDWAEGPALVTLPDRVGIITNGNSLALDVIRPVNWACFIRSCQYGDPWDRQLAHVGMDLSFSSSESPPPPTAPTCSSFTYSGWGNCQPNDTQTRTVISSSPSGCSGGLQVTSQSCSYTAPVANGVIMISPNLPIALVVNGVRLQFEVLATPFVFSMQAQTVDNATYHKIPYGDSIHGGQRVVAAPGFPGAFVGDSGKLWKVSCLQAITKNSSSIEMIPTANYLAMPTGGDLFCHL